MNLSAGDTHRPNTRSSAFKKLTLLAQMKLIPWNVPPSQPHILAWELLLGFQSRAEMSPPLWLFPGRVAAWKVRTLP